MKAILLILVVLIAGCTESMLQYRGNFSLDYPKDWNQTANPILVLFSSGNTTLTVAETDQSLEAAMENARRLQAMYRNFTLLSEENLTINGLPAVRRVFNWTDVAHGIDFTQSQVWIRGQKLYVITTTSLAGMYEKDRPIFERMISSFKIK